MIRPYITEHFRKILHTRPTLVVFDPDRRYKEIIIGMADDQIRVFDTSTNILIVREEITSFYATVIAEDINARMVVYVPFKEPLTRQEKLMDPFYIFSFGGAIFPFDASDRYESLCKGCYMDKEQQIDELFLLETPDFDTIDALGGGNTWAKLQTLTGGKSEREIILALLAPSPKQEEVIKKDKTWLKEYKDLARLIGLETKEKTFDGIRNELWRFMLFSEFVFDLPIPLPKSLADIPVAKNSTKSLVLDICRSLRNDKSNQEVYIEKADFVAEQLGLASLFHNEYQLGEIITFSFEDNTYFYHFINLLKQGKMDEANEITSRIKENIWLHHDEERRRYWKMGEFGFELIKLTEINTKPGTSLKAVISQYTASDYKIDQLQRRFEKQAMEIMEENTALADLKNLVRTAYKKYVERSQKLYQQLVSAEHWPVEGMLSNTQVFTRHIQPLLKAKTKTAYVLVDALRFELAKELEEHLEKYFLIQTTPACALLPTVTKYGMVALLPDADKLLSINAYKDGLEAFMGEQPLLSLAHRREYFKDKLGDRCSITTLDQLVSAEVPDVDLLIVTTNEIDNAGENLANNALVSIQHAVQNLIKVLNRLKLKSYEKIVLATDHGFVLHPEFLAGDNVSKPGGEWLMIKPRSLAGAGTTPEYALGFTPTQIGLKSEIKNFIFLKNYSVFEKNTTYFHEGLSLQENIVPVMVLTAHKAKKEEKLEVTITYKGKSAGFITTRRPLLEISCFKEGELGFDPIAIRLEALAKGEPVGKPGSDERVNEVTNELELMPNHAYKIPLEMDVDYEGSFEVRLSDPVTNKTLAAIILETDYIS
jgi:hypothetical protein